MNSNLPVINEIIVVEGRYDKSAVLNAVQATVVETSGFSVFSNKEKIALFRRLALKRGLIILTDSDRAGFFIRGRLSGMFAEQLDVKHAYIPDVTGRERRKSTSSKEGKIGVEGMSPDVILNALKQAGATFTVATVPTDKKPGITMSDLFRKGLTGSVLSTKKRRDLLRRLELPSRLSSKKLLEVLNILFTREEFLLFLTSSD